MIAGEGDLRQDLEEKISRLGLDTDVILLGWVDSAATTFIPYIDIFSAFSMGSNVSRRVGSHGGRETSRCHQCRGEQARDHRWR